MFTCAHNKSIIYIYIYTFIYVYTYIFILIYIYIYIAESNALSAGFLGSPGPRKRRETREPEILGNFSGRRERPLSLPCSNAYCTALRTIIQYYSL